MLTQKEILHVYVFETGKDSETSLWQEPFGDGWEQRDMVWLEEGPSCSAAEAPTIIEQNDECKSERIMSFAIALAGLLLWVPMHEEQMNSTASGRVANGCIHLFEHSKVVNQKPSWLQWFQN